MDLQAQLNRFRVILALRFTFLCLGIFIVSAWLDLSTGIMALVPAMFLVMFVKDESLKASLGLVAGVYFGGIVVFLLSYLWSQVPVLFLTISLIVIFVMAYVAAQSMRGRSDLLSFAVGAEICLLSAVFAEVGGAADGVDAAIVWMTELPVGVVVLWVLLIGLWPFPSTRDLDQLVEAARRECATLLRGSIDPVREGIATTFVPSRMNLKVLGDITRMVNQNANKYRFAAHSHGFMLSRLDGLAHVYANIRYMQRAFEDLPDPGLTPSARHAAAEIMMAMADRLESGSERDISDIVADMQQEEQQHARQAADSLASLRIAARISGFLVAVDSLKKAIADYAQPQEAANGLPATLPAAEPPRHLMTDSLQPAIKIVIGVLIGILAFMFAGLPASGFLVIAILIVLIQPNLGRAHLRFRLWFPGVFFGSLWALCGILVLSLLPHFAVYLAWLLPGLLVAGYLGMGPDRVAYVGMQIAAGMATILGMAVFPANNLMSAEARTIGAMVGFLISLSIYHFIWPVDPAALLRQNLVRNLRDLGELLSRIARVESSERDERNEAELAHEIATLKLQVQSNMGLLYDISYLVTGRLKPAYNYQVLWHQLGMAHSQIWCLQKYLSDIEDLDRRRTILAPVAESIGTVSQTIQILADRLELKQSASAEDIRVSDEVLRKSLVQYYETTSVDAKAEEQHDMRYGINAIGMLAYHLRTFADAMDLGKAASPPRTAELEKLYEAADA